MKEKLKISHEQICYDMCKIYLNDQISEKPKIRDRAKLFEKVRESFASQSLTIPDNPTMYKIYEEFLQQHLRKSKLTKSDRTLSNFKKYAEIVYRNAELKRLTREYCVEYLRDSPCLGIVHTKVGYAENIAYFLKTYFENNVITAFSNNDYVLVVYANEESRGIINEMIQCDEIFYE